MISDLAQQILRDIERFADEGARAMPGREELRPFLESALKRMNLVSRDEFEAQQAVLMRTREKLETLEGRVTQLEARLRTEAHRPSPPEE